MNINNKMYDNHLQGTSETTHQQFKSYYIQFIVLCIVCIIVVGLIVRSNYLEPSERKNTSEIVILFIASALVLYRTYKYFM
jgi:hypothetical protein